MLKYFFSVIVFISYLTSNAQIETISSKEYGRIFDITYHPSALNTLYAATTFNHILKSENNGLSWKVFYSFPEKLSRIKRLKTLQNNKLTFVVEGGLLNQNHNSIYVLDTTSGLIVNQYNIPLPPGTTSSYVSSYDIYQTNTNFIIAQQYFEIGLGVQAKVYFSNNGGSSWTEIYYNVNNNGVFPTTVAINPGDPTKLFICRTGGYDPDDWGGLLVSNNSGLTWTEKMSGVEFDPIAFNPGNSNEILVGSRYDTQIQNLYKSTDGGNTWTEVFQNWSSQFSSGILNITYNPQSPNKCILLTVEDLIVTNDNFTTFNQYNHLDGQYDGDIYYYGTAASFNPFNSDEIFISANNYPFFSNNSGATLERFKTPYSNNSGKTELVENDAESHLYYGIQNGFVHLNRVTNIETPIAVVPITYYVNYSSQHFFDKNRNGRTYSYNSGFSASSMVFSNDHGQTYGFVSMTNQFIHAVNSSPANSNRVWASVSNDFDQSELIRFNISDLQNIQQSTVNLPTAGLVLDIAHDQFDEETKIIALNNKIYYTSDEGNTWEERSNGLENLINANGIILSIFKDPSNNQKIFLGTTGGVYYSSDYGNNWVQILDGFITHKVYSPSSNPNVIVAISHDSAISEFTIKYTEDGGDNWDTITSAELEYVYSNESSCEFSPTSAIVYINTTDLGLVKFEIELNSLSNPDFETTNQFTVYPNPSKETINIGLNANTAIAKITIYDMAGKKIKEYDSTENIDISALESGIYLVKIDSTENTIEYHKIIKE